MCILSPVVVVTPFPLPSISLLITPSLPSSSLCLCVSVYSLLLSPVPTTTLLLTNALRILQVQDQYPWNWEWNFNWIRGKDIDNRPIIQAERKKLREEFEGSLFEDSKARFRRMIAEKHFDGNITAVGRLQFEYPPLPRDVGTGERIPRGSKLRDNGDHPKLPKSIRNILYRESALRYRRQ